MTAKQFRELVTRLRNNHIKQMNLDAENRAIQRDIKKGYKETFLAIRTELNMSIDEIAEATGRYYTNLYYPSIDVLILLLDLLDGVKIKKHVKRQHKKGKS